MRHLPFPPQASLREASGNLRRWARPSAFYTEGILGVRRAVLYLIGTDVLPYQRNPESPLSLSLLKKTGAGPFRRPRPVLGRKSFLKKKKLISGYPGLCCFVRTSCSRWGLLTVWLLLLWSTGSRLVGFNSCSTWASLAVSLGLQSPGSVVAMHRLSCSMARGIFLDQGLNLCPLH